MAQHIIRIQKELLEKLKEIKEVENLKSYNAVVNKLVKKRLGKRL